MSILGRTKRECAGCFLFPAYSLSKIDTKLERFPVTEREFLDDFGRMQDAWQTVVINTIDSIGGRVILVGHSVGGLIISDVAESIPSKIEKLVYIAAFVPLPWQSGLARASPDTSSVLVANLTSPMTV